MKAVQFDEPRAPGQRYIGQCVHEWKPVEGTGLHACTQGKRKPCGAVCRFDARGLIWLFEAGDIEPTKRDSRSFV